MKQELLPCPLCGHKAFVQHMRIPEGDFGWDAGCPRFCNDDKWHHISADKPAKFKPIVHCLGSKAKAIEEWNKKACLLAK